MCNIWSCSTSKRGSNDHMTGSSENCLELGGTFVKKTNIPSTVLPLSACTITGSPKLKTSPHYPNFELEKYDNILVKDELHDIHDTDPSETICKDQTYSLPIVHAHAHEWATLVTCLNQLYQLQIASTGNDLQQLQ